MAGSMVMLAGVFVVLSVWDSVARLRSIETREAIEGFLAEPPLDELALTVESVIQLMHVTSMVVAVAAVAVVALGWQVMQRSRGARLALSVIAVPLLFAGLVTGGLMTAIVAAATAMLWLSPSREWFAGEPLPEAPSRAAGRADASPDSPQRRDDAPSHTSGDHPALPSPTSPTSPQVTPSPWAVSFPSPDRRPDSVTTAMALTLVVSGLVFAMTLISLVLVVSQPDLVLDELRRQDPEIEESGLSEATLLATAYVSGGIGLLWSGLAVVLAVLMAGRRAWAARALRISAVVCTVLCVFSAIASVAALVPGIAALVTFACLRRPESRAWFSRDPR